jgi:serine/threonine protein kinase
VEPAGGNYSARMCPICGEQMGARLCPTDKIATLLVDAPRIDSSRVEAGTLVGGRYVVEDLIGKGGFGSVFRARHTGTGQPIAIKTLTTAGEYDALHLRRFFQEARVTAALRHPNTIRVFDFGQDDTGLIFLAMELLDGVTLKQELRGRKKEDRVFTMNEALHIGIGVCKSLQEAHRAGLVHRDLKPDNIFLHQVDGDEPTVKVLDFGIVKFANSTLTLGSDSGVPGTPAYMSPEQAVKRDLDGRSDLYSLGVVLYQLVSGVVPLRGENIVQTLYMHVHERAPDLRPRVRTPVSMRFVQLVHSALAKNPDLRPSSASDMREGLERCLDESLREPVTAMISQSMANVEAYPGPDETLTAPQTPSPAFFAAPVVESQDISLSDVDPSRRDVFAPPPPKNSVPMWLIGVLVLILGLLGGVLLILLTEPAPVAIETKEPELVAPRAAQPELVAPPPAEVAADEAPEGDAEPEATTAREADTDPPEEPKKTTRRRVRLRRPRPTPKAPPPEEDASDEILDQKI